MENNFDMSLLDATLDDLNDMPEFAVFPPGAHRASIKWETKTVNDHPALELKLTLLETHELANADDEALAPGAESSMLLLLDNEFGQGKLKQIAKPLAAHLGVGSLREITEMSSGMEVEIVTKIRTNKNDKTQKYLDIVKLEVA